eukprot:TRINITY_DN25019_c0_g1_i1.p1 TRINITY_DN25019_c0_g1~~TRINITY_DN25019_c0_g1_i1.p1  ORF type:complete len:163 (-),score=20.43 TRINITY_DN25019_c0_g1_i1:370-858(-)
MVNPGSVVCGGLMMSVFLALTIFGIYNLVDVSAANYQKERCFVLQRRSREFDDYTILEYKVALGSMDGPTYEFSTEQNLNTLFEVGEKFEPCFSARNADGHIRRITDQYAGASFTGYLILTLINGCCLAGACVGVLKWAWTEMFASKSSDKEDSKSQPEQSC